MDKVFEKNLKLAGLAAVLVTVFAATWVVLDRTEHRPGWLTVEAPAAAVVEQPLEIRVTLKNSVEATEIVCSLHRAGADRKIRGYLASSGSFIFEVPEREDMAFASAIIFLSPTGNWSDGTRAVSTKLMPVKRDGTAVESLGLKKTRVYHYSTAAESATAEPWRRPSVWVHPILCVLLLSSAFLCAAKAGRKRSEASREETGVRTIWLALAAIFVLSAFLELSGVVGHLAAWGRRLAQEQNLYDLRKTYQKAAMAAVAAGALGLFVLFIRAMRKPGSHRFLWGVGIGLAAYLSVSFVSVLSFHAVDIAGAMTWHGVSPVDTVRGMGALVSLISAVAALRSRKETPGG